MFDKYQEHLDSQPDNSRWDGFDRGDTDRDPEPGFLTFSQANAEAKALALEGRKVRVVRIADGCFELHAWNAEQALTHKEMWETIWF